MYKTIYIRKGDESFWERGETHYFFEGSALAAAPVRRLVLVRPFRLMIQIPLRGR